MPSDMEIWNSPNLENDYFRKYPSWERRMSGINYDYATFMENEIENAIDKGEIYQALMWLNRLEINLPEKLTRYQEFEHILTPLYHKHRAEQGKYTSHLIDLNIPRINGDIWEYQNKHKGERCFILGTGPSLDKQNLKELKNEITFGCNLIFRNFDNMGFEPTYYTAEDFFFFRRHDKEISGMGNTVKFIPNFRNSLTYNGKTIFMNIIPDDVIYEDFPFFSINAGKRLWSAANATFLNLQLAYFMGFSEVYLLGIDHEYNFPASMRVFNQNDMRLNNKDTSHFIKGAYDPKEAYHFPILKRSEKAYAKAKLAFELNNRKIVNCTPGTKLDIFEKESLEKVLKTKKPVSKAASAPEYAISIIIPAWNAERTLSSAIDSAMNQLLKAEIIIVDDGSTDGTAELIDEYRERFKNIRLISQKHKGQASARNAGMKSARGKYITFLDADDALMPNILDKAIYKMEKDNADILSFDYNQIVNGANTQQATDYFLDISGLKGVEAFLETQTSRPWGRVFKAEFLKEHDLQFLDTPYYEDMLFNIPASYYAKKITYLPFKGYNWNRTRRALTAQTSVNQIEALSMQLNNLKNFLIKTGHFNILYKAYIIFAYRIADSLLNEIRKEKDTSVFSELALAFMDFIEQHDLDNYLNIAIGNSFKNGLATNIMTNMFLYAGKDVNSGPERKIPKFPLEKLVSAASKA